MFFRREKPKVASFEERLAVLRKNSFTSDAIGSGKVKVTREGIAAVVEDVPATKEQDARSLVDKAGLMVGEEVAVLMNRGYQMFWRTPSGKRLPATANQLKALHAFEEDLKEGLGLVSLYNQGLGTISELHLYDRVEHRDDGNADKPWQKPA